MKRIQLTRGYDAFVDDDLYEELRKYRWYADIFHDGSNVYAKNSSLGSMHRYIMKLLGYEIDNKVIDHIDCDGLNNTRKNLRLVNSRRENSRNRKEKDIDKHSEYTGVTFREHADRWCAKIRVDGKDSFLGYYDTAEEAGMAYDRAVLYYCPEENTILNFPERVDEHDLSAPYERQYKRTKSTNTSGYRGVNLGYKGKAKASINVGGRDGKKIHLGTFATVEDAATIYDLAQVVLHRTLGKEPPEHVLNFPWGVDNYSDELISEMVDFLYEKGVM